MSTESDKEYLKKHNIPQLFNDITQELFREKPDNPVQFVIGMLKARKDQRDGASAAPTTEADAAANK